MTTNSIKEQSNAPTIGFDACQSLRVWDADEEKWHSIEELDWLSFYLLCRSFLLERNWRAWCEVHKTLIAQECDEYTKWSVIMEMIRFRVVEVVNGELCVKDVVEKKEKAA